MSAAAFRVGGPTYCPLLPGLPQQLLGGGSGSRAAGAPGLERSAPGPACPPPPPRAAGFSPPREWEAAADEAGGTSRWSRRCLPARPPAFLRPAGPSRPRGSPRRRFEGQGSAERRAQRRVWSQAGGRLRGERARSSDGWMCEVGTRPALAGDERGAEETLPAGALSPPGFAPGDKCREMGEQPIFTTRAHVFQIDPTTKKNWVPASKQAVTVSYFYDGTRNSYRIISVDGTKVIINSTITPNMTFTKTSQKFGQWADSRANTVFGLGFSSEQQLTKFAEKFQEVKEAARLARDRSQEKMETSSNHSQESGRETPCSTRASSVNGTDDEKASHGGPADAQLKMENEKLKIALAQSTSNVKKWESELQTLRESNARLTTALQESAASIEHWKKQFSICKDENDQLQSKIEELEEQCIEIDKERDRNAQLNRRLQELETELQDKELELEDLRKQGEIIPQLMTECETVSQKLQVAEKRNKDLEEKVKALRTEVEESKHRQNNLKTELQTFLDVLDGKIDELQDFRQGLSKLSVDN